MRKTRNLLRRVYDSLIEGREREAQRAITEYLRHHPIRIELPLEGFTRR